MIVVRPGLLTWAPGLQQTPGLGFDRIFAFSDCNEDDDFRGGEFSVVHYSRVACGQAFGPLALDQTLRFCSLLDTEVGKGSHVALVTQQDNFEERANAAVLLGAYLMLRLRWDVKRVELVLAAEASACYNCSWSDARSNVISPTLKVKDCWAGLDMALKMQWLSQECLQDDTLTALACSQYRAMVSQYDATWLVPGEVAVSADPMSTINDPNPATCRSLLPANVEKEEEIALTPHSVSSHEIPTKSESPEPVALPNKVYSPPLFPEVPADDCSNCTEALMPGNVRDTDGESDHSSVDTQPLVGNNYLQGHNLFQKASSCHTVCKDYTHCASSNAVSGPCPKDFVSWCKQRGMTSVIRLNFNEEPGLQEFGGSYDQTRLLQHGFRHMDIPVVDKNGGLPDVQTIKGVLEEYGTHTSDCNPSKAVLVHCKGGFGRSMIIACCLVIYKYDVDGRALLGWARIVRPGAITTSMQETFLCSLRGRADLKSYLARNAQQPCCSIS